jgi:hypothetical protein
MIITIFFFFLLKYYSDMLKLLINFTFFNINFERKSRILHLIDLLDWA